MIRQLFVAGMTAFVGAFAHAQDVTKAFTYQGTLNASGAPANGVYDFRFTLYNDAGAVVADPLCVEDLAVTDGVFDAVLDFGPVAAVSEFSIPLRTRRRSRRSRRSPRSRLR